MGGFLRLTCKRCDHMKFSPTLVERYIAYMQKEHGLLVTPEQAQNDLEQLSALHALVARSSTEGGLDAPALRHAIKADRRED